MIQELKSDFDQEEIFEVGDELPVGAEVNVAAGPFMGFDAKVIGVLPAGQSVKVLLDFLGREIHAELPSDSVVLTENSLHRAMAK